MPASKPTSGSSLNASNPYGITVAWFLNENTGTTATDAGTNALVGTLTNMDPEHEMIVTGGTGGNAAYNQTYSPSGSEYGKPKYVSADNNYKLSFWYGMDPEMDGAWYLWPVAAYDPWMDSYASTKAGNVAAEGGTYSNSFAVAEGDAGPDAWFDRGLHFVDDGSRDHVLVTSPTPLQFGTGDFTICIGYEREAATQGMIFCIGDGFGLSIRENNFYLRFGGAWPEFPSASACLTTGSTHHIAIKFDRDGYARLYHNGSYVSQVSIAAYASTSITGNVFIGASGDLAYGGDGWNWDGYIDYVYSMPGLMSDANAATLTADPYLDMTSGSSPTVPIAAISQYYRRRRTA